MKQLDLFREIIVDNFAGGGGASTGIEMATGLSVDIAINHDPAAIAMHKANHPDTEHYCESVWEVDPQEAVKGRPVGLAWFSPDCKHFSKAKGGKPVNKEIRGLAWVAVRWAATVKPRVIMLENVEEFKTWGPVGKDGQPIKEKQGVTFKRFVRSLKKLGYEVDFRELRACDYGAPTIRKRFFMVARRDGRPIVWPEPTHGDPRSLAVSVGKLKPWRTASEIIDWSIGTPSIFSRKKPLADNTMRRIARGIQKFVLDDPEPYEAPGGALSFLAQYYTETNPGEVRGQSLKEPIYTIPTANRFALVKAFLVAYYGASVGQRLDEPLHTITTRDRFGLVTLKGHYYQIADIGMRMLQPHELYAGQGFPDNYIINRDHEGNAYPKTEQVARCGNAVPPPFADALVRANLPEFCVKTNRYKRAAVN